MPLRIVLAPGLMSVGPVSAMSAGGVAGSGSAGLGSAGSAIVELMAEGRGVGWGVGAAAVGAAAVGTAVAVAGY